MRGAGAVAATISMDQPTFVIGERCDVELGDAVVLIGGQGDERIGAEEWRAYRTRSATRSDRHRAPPQRVGVSSSVADRLAEIRARARSAAAGGGQRRDLLLGAGD